MHKFVAYNKKVRHFSLTNKTGFLNRKSFLLKNTCTVKCKCIEKWITKQFHFKIKLQSDKNLNLTYTLRIKKKNGTSVIQAQECRQAD